MDALRQILQAVHREPELRRRLTDAQWERIVARAGELGLIKAHATLNGEVVWDDAALERLFHESQADHPLPDGEDDLWLDIEEAMLAPTKEDKARIRGKSGRSAAKEKLLGLDEVHERLAAERWWEAAELEGLRKFAALLPKNADQDWIETLANVGSDAALAAFNQSYGSSRVAQQAFVDTLMEGTTLWITDPLVVRAHVRNAITALARLEYPAFKDSKHRWVLQSKEVNRYVQYSRFCQMAWQQFPLQAGLRHVLQVTPGVEMAFRWCPPGVFLMGSPESDSMSEEYSSTERPQTRVRLTRGFWMGETPVTQRQFGMVAGYNPSYYQHKSAKPEFGRTRYWKRISRLLRPRFSYKKYVERLAGREPQYSRANARIIERQAETHDQPVEHVTWWNVMDFLKEAAAFTRRAINLPTEAQWEYACRAGSTTRWCFGDDKEMLPAYAHFGVENGRGPKAVGQLLPNAWGLHDMHGNIAEWCLDVFGGYPGGEVCDWIGLDGRFLYRDQENFITQFDSSDHVMRGLALWAEKDPESCRSAWRGAYSSQQSGEDFLGFRVMFHP